MTSIDTNILFHAINSASPQQKVASQFLSSIADQDDIIISEFVLAEFYQLLRNTSVLPKSLNHAAACEVIASYRHHPHWQIVGFPQESQNLHDSLWQKVTNTANLARRRFFDIRIALTLQSFGVKKFATANTKDFQNLGFERVWNPLYHLNS